MTNERPLLGLMTDPTCSRFFFFFFFLFFLFVAHYFASSSSSSSYSLLLLPLSQIIQIIKLQQFSQISARFDGECKIFICLLCALFLHAFSFSFRLIFSLMFGEEEEFERKGEMQLGWAVGFEKIWKFFLKKNLRCELIEKLFIN